MQDENEHQINELCCIKCRDSNSKYDDLTDVVKGIEKVIEYSRKINDSVLTDYLIERKTSKGVVKIHRECQKQIYNELKRKGNVPVAVPNKITKVSTRLSICSTFNWKEHCFLCEKPCKKNQKHFDRNDFRLVATIPFRNQTLSVCCRRNDDWALEVQRRALECHDFVAAEARYHVSCYERFQLGRTKVGVQLSTPTGRPTDQKCQNYFRIVCEWLENEGEAHSLSEIHCKMTDIAGSSDDVYSQKWLKKKLQEKYKDHIFFTEVAGKSNVVCFRNMVDYLINDEWYSSREENQGQEA